MDAVTDATFAGEVLASETPVLVEFGAPWCRPCKAIETSLGEIADASAGRLKLVSLDPAPPAIPLSADELTALHNDALATQQEFADAKHRADNQAQTFATAGYAAPAPYPTPETADTYKPDPFSWPIPQRTTPHRIV